MAIIRDFDDKKSAKQEKETDRIFEGENDDIYTGSNDDVFNDDQTYGDLGESSLGDYDPVSGGGFRNNFSNNTDDEALVYNVSSHQGVQNFYEGDSRTEKLVLQVTEEQWQQSWLQSAICDFEQFINQARPGDIFDFSIYDHAGRYLQFKAANFQAVLIELLTGGSRSTSEEDSVSDGDVTA